MMTVPAASPSLEKVRVLATDLTVADYTSAIARLQELAREPRPSAVAACNTHLLSVARANPNFRQVLEQFDLCLPDGMPLVWAMRQKGAAIEDRVYGPYLMKHTLEATPRPWKHFFFGGKQETLDKMVAAAKKLQPEIEVVGTLSPPYRTWSEEDQASFAAEIQAADPDFIWVALGGERQERWILDQRHRYQRGVFLAVGDAFELLAGTRPFAPAWMQRHSLTWLYRLWREPGRLWKRYLRYNSMYLYFTVRDAIFPTPKV